jgi:hypothetical protein
MADNVTTPPATDYSGVREYIGARYVPVFANPPEWDDTRGYEPLTIVLHKGNSYTSTQYVPTGIDISNTEYWLQTGNWNAQVEAYREEVLRFDGRITQNADGIKANMAAIADEATARASADTALQQLIESEETARKAADTELANRMNDFKRMTPLENEKGRHAVFIGDSFMAPSTSYPQKLAYFVSQLLEWTMHNYAVGGTGWYDEGGVGKNFLHQLEDSVAKITVPADQVSYVVIGGGFNDWNDPTPLNYNQLYNAALNTVVKAHQLYQNAEIVCIPMMFRNYGVDAHMHDLYSAIVSGINASNTPVKLITNAYMWQLAFKNVDGVHPTTELYKIMAEYVCSWILGGGVKVDRLYTQNLSGGGISTTLNFFLTPTTVTACLDAVVLPTMTAGQQVTVSSQVHLSCAASSAKRLVVYNSSSKAVGQFVWSGSTIMFIAATDIAAATYAGGSISYPLWVKSPQ